MEETYTEPVDTASLDQFRTNLGRDLLSLFQTVEIDRLPFEEEWLKDLRQLKAIYDPATLKLINNKRSKANISITRAKVRASTARVCDILFPAAGDKHFGVVPSPVPELDNRVTAEIVAQILEMTGKEPTMAELTNIIYDEAVRRAANMEKTIEDQLNRVKYKEIIRNVLDGGHIYGTGILKGPLVEEHKAKRWVPIDGDWQVIELKSISPFCESVSIWDIYPDMSVTKVEDMDYVFQRYVFPKHKVVGLKRRPGFRGDVIDEYLKAHPKGNTAVKQHEVDLGSLSRDELGAYQKSAHSNKYEIIEYWGYLSLDKLAECGVPLDPATMGTIVVANVWMIDGYVIKAVVSPLEGATIPYYFYYYEKDETSIYGTGLPKIMRDPSILFNAGIRALLDNAAVSAGPYIEANTELLHDDEDPTDLYPFRVFQRKGTGIEASARAINVYDIASNTGELLGLVNFFSELADVVTTIPRYMQGEVTNMGQAGRSPSVVSMLMGAANITVKDQVKFFDEGITKPFIRALYYWNMNFNPKEDIKGDFEVRAEGSTTLIAKEVLMEKMNNWLAITNNPTDLMYTNRDKSLTKAAEVMELGTFGLVKTPAQIAAMQEQQAADAAAQRAEIMEIEKLRALSSGHVGDKGGTSMKAISEKLNQSDLMNGELPNVEGPDVQNI